jgi:hypothetical protein
MLKDTMSTMNQYHEVYEHEPVGNLGVLYATFWSQATTDSEPVLIW